MRVAGYEYGKLIDYIDRIINNSTVVNKLLVSVIEAESSNFDEHNKGVVAIKKLMDNEKITTYVYKRGCMNIKDVCAEIKRICA